MKTLIARWETARKKYWFELYYDNDGLYSYKSDNGAGYFPKDYADSDEKAIMKFNGQHVFFAKLSGQKMRRVFPTLTK